MSANKRLQATPSSHAHEPRLRSSCDRCHELKNRCARVGGPDSRCERCERLDIDCVYSTIARIGRPLGAGGKKAGRERGRERDDKPQRQSNPRPAKRRTPSFARQREKESESETLELHVSPPRDDLEADSIWAQQASSSVSNNEPADRAPITTNTITNPNSNHISNSLNATMSDKDQDWSLHSSVPSPFHEIQPCLDMPGSHSDLIAPASLGPNDPSPLQDWGQPQDIDFGIDRAAHPFSSFEDLLANPPTAFSEQMLAPSRPVANDFEFSTPDFQPDQSPNHPVPLDERLLQLQNHMGAIAAKYHDAHSPHHQIPNDEALSTIKSLLDMTKSFLSLGSHHHQLPAVLRRSSNTLCHVGILQLLTCYTYLLQILEPTVTRLAELMKANSSIACPSPGSAPSGHPSLVSSNALGASTNGNPGGSTASLDSPTKQLLSPAPDIGAPSAALQLGGFSFVSQPALAAELLLRSIYHMMTQVHNNVNLLALGRGGLTDDMEKQAMDESNEDTEVGDKPHQGPDMAVGFNPIIRSARAVMTVTHAQKRALFQRMNNHLVDNSSRPGLV